MTIQLQDGCSTPIVTDDGPGFESPRRLRGLDPGERSARLGVRGAGLGLRHERDVVDQRDRLRHRRQRCVEIRLGGRIADAQ